MPSRGQLVLHLLTAAGLGGVLGVERELSEQPAGFRTHLLVGLGSALFAVISAFGFQALLGEGPRDLVQADVTRVASQIVVGIGFLGGGAILKYGASVRGLTTAASLWVTAAVGTAAGIGLLWLAAVTTGVALSALAFLRPLRALIRRFGEAHVEFVIVAEAEAKAETLAEELRMMGADVEHVRLEEEGEAGSRTFVLTATLPKRTNPEQVVSRLATRPGVRSVDWTR